MLVSRDEQIFGDAGSVHETPLLCAQLKLFCWLARREPIKGITIRPRSNNYLATPNLSDIYKSPLNHTHVLFTASCVVKCYAFCASAFVRSLHVAAFLCT